MFNVNRRNNQFLYASTVMDGDGTLAEPLISNNNNKNDSNITSVLNYKYKSLCYIQLLHLEYMN